MAEQYQKDNLVTIQPLLLNNITRNGSSRDFEAMLDDFRTVFPLIMPEYSSLEDDDYGVAIVQFVLWMLDNLNYQLDFYVQQRTRKWCRSRQSLSDILEWFNYFIPSYDPATSAYMRFYMAAFPTGFADGLTIPEGTWIQSTVEIEGDYVDFETDEDLILDKVALASDATGVVTVQVGPGNTTNFQIGYRCEIGDDDTSAMVATLLAADDVTGTLTFDTVIPATYTTAQNAYVAMLEGLVDITEGKTYTDPGISGDGMPFQEFNTVREKVIDGTIVLKEDGTPWTKVDTVLYSDPDDQVFQIRKTIGHRVTCITGDGYSGKAPTGTVTLTYRVGGGRRGNLGKNLLTNLKDTILYHGAPVSINCTNDQSTIHGGEQMTVERAKIVGPATIFALDRAVTREDFEALLENYPGVSRVSAIKVNDIAAIYLLGNGVTAMTTAEKEEILDYLEERRVGADSFLTLYDPLFVSIDITLQIRMKNDASKTFEEAQEEIETELSEFFDPDENSKLKFGRTDDEEGNLFASDIYDIADDDEKDVEYALMPVFTVRPIVVYGPAWPSDSEVIDFEVSEEYDKTEVWSLTCVWVTGLGVASFQVRGSISGLQAGLAYSGTPYTSDNGEVAFTVESSVIGFQRTDSARITILPLKNEYLPIGDTQFPVQGTITVEEIT